MEKTAIFNLQGLVYNQRDKILSPTDNEVEHTFKIDFHNDEQFGRIWKGFQEMVKDFAKTAGDKY